ncbi:Hok/Gef family protein (plasmid) [Erwinia sp. E602]|nr:Hok/Gef family protein [Erwinia sp. E602]
MHSNIRVSSYLPQGKEKTVMKLPQSTLFWCVLTLCLTLLIFTFLMRKSLCEIRYRDPFREVAAMMTCEPGK